jgi:hypothetical protein
MEVRRIHLNHVLEGLIYIKHNSGIGGSGVDLELKSLVLSP